MYVGRMDGDVLLGQRPAHTECTRIGFPSLPVEQPGTESLALGSRSLEEQGACLTLGSSCHLSLPPFHPGLQQHENCRVSIPSDPRSAIKLKLVGIIN